MSNGEHTQDSAKSQELQQQYRPLGIKAVVAAALMLKRKKAIIKPA